MASSKWIAYQCNQLVLEMGWPVTRWLEICHVERDVLCQKIHVTYTIYFVFMLSMIHFKRSTINRSYELWPSCKPCSFLPMTSSLFMTIVDQVYGHSYQMFLKHWIYAHSLSDDCQFQFAWSESLNRQPCIISNYCVNVWLIWEGGLLVRWDGKTLLMLTAWIPPSSPWLPAIPHIFLKARHHKYLI